MFSIPGFTSAAKVALYPRLRRSPAKKRLAAFGLVKRDQFGGWMSVTADHNSHLFTLNTLYDSEALRLKLSDGYDHEYDHSLTTSQMQAQ